MKSIYLLIIFFSIACASTKDTANPIINSNDSSSSIPKIIFVNYKVAKDAAEQVQLVFINKIVANGQFKDGNSTSKVKNPGDFMCIQLDQQSIPIDSLHLKNPLINNVEYVDADGNLGRKIIELDSAELSFRMQLHPRTTSLSFVIIDNPRINLTKLDL